MVGGVWWDGWKSVVGEVRGVVGGVEKCSGRDNVCGWRGVGEVECGGRVWEGYRGEVGGVRCVVGGVRCVVGGVRCVVGGVRCVVGGVRCVVGGVRCVVGGVRCVVGGVRCAVRGWRCVGRSVVCGRGRGVFWEV